MRHWIRFISQWRKSSNKKEEKELNKIISRINDYEVYLYNIYLYLRKHYDIPTIEWLKKRGPNPHLQP